MADDLDAAPLDDATRTVPTREPAPPLARGTLVGRYVALDVIGRGGMGIVYRAWDPTLSRAVALKLVDVSERGVRHERLLREAQSLAQLSHPNVVSVHDVGTTATGVFIAMELVDGKTVVDWSNERDRTEREIRAVYLQAGAGLAAAHAVGLVHRDFKPANIMIGSDGRTRVLDFGLARAIDDASPELPARVLPSEDSGTIRLDPLTKPGIVLGTPRYMAPEQLVGKPATPAGDQFSFCVSLWEALFHTRPFAAKTIAELVHKQHRHELDRPPRARVSSRLEAALRRGLSPDPRDRFPSLAPLLDELRHDPARGRRLAIVVGLATVAAIVLGAGWLRGDRPAAAPCVERDAFAGVWAPDRRDALHATFTATGAPAAEATFASVTRGLDGYAGAWTTMRRDACLKTRVDGVQSEHLLDLRVRCLDRRRDALRAQLEVFAAADRAVIAKAVEATRALPPIDDCADVGLLEATVPPPSEPAARARVATATAELAVVAAQLASGRYTEGLRLLPSLLHTAESLGYRPLLAEVELRQGGLLDRTGSYADAERAYRSATIDADAGRADAVRAEALVQLVWMIGERDGHYQDARRQADVARGAIDRLDRPDRLLARYYRTLGVLDYREGKYDAALASSQRAVELARRAFGADDPYVASCVMDVGLARYYLGDYDRARQDIEQALALWLAVYGSDHGDVAAAYDNLGEIDRAQHHEIQAIAMYRSAAAIWERLGSVDRADVFVNIGEIERARGTFELARTDLERAVAVFEHELGPIHPRLIPALTGLGRVVLDQGDAERAVALLERAQQLAAGNPGDPVDLADGQFALARALHAVGREPARARTLATQALDAYAKGGVRGAPGATSVHAWLASLDHPRGG